MAVGWDGGEPAVDLATVGVGELEGRQERLGGDAADAAGAGLFDGLVEGVLGEAVEAFDAVAEPEVDALPVFAAVGEGLVVLGSGFGRDGDRLLCADLGRSGGARLGVGQGQAGIAAEAGGFERALDASGGSGAGHALVAFVVGVLLGDQLEREPGGDAADPGLLVDGLLRCLAEDGYEVVEEAATAVIAQAQAQGEAEPWTRPSFIDEVVDLQKQRQLEASATGSVQVFDRSPVCTHALANYLGRPVPRALMAEIERITAEEIYERQVLFVRNLGFCEPTSARRISFQESLVFEKIHEQSYRAFGFEIIDIPAGDLADRVAAVNAVISHGS